MFTPLGESKSRVQAQTKSQGVKTVALPRRHWFWRDRHDRWQVSFEDARQQNQSQTEEPEPLWRQLSSPTCPLAVESDPFPFPQRKEIIEEIVYSPQAVLAGVSLERQPWMVNWDVRAVYETFGCANKYLRKGGRIYLVQFLSLYPVWQASRWKCVEESNYLTAARKKSDKKGLVQWHTFLRNGPVPFFLLLPTLANNISNSRYG